MPLAGLVGLLKFPDSHVYSKSSNFLLNLCYGATNMRADTSGQSNCSVCFLIKRRIL